MNKLTKYIPLTEKQLKDIYDDCKSAMLAREKAERAAGRCLPMTDKNIMNVSDWVFVQIYEAYKATQQTLAPDVCHSTADGRHLFQNDSNGRYCFACGIRR